MHSSVLIVRKYNNVTHTVSRTLVHLQLTICFMKFLLFTKYHKNHTSLCSRQKGQPNIVLCRSKKDDPKRNAVLNAVKTRNESFRSSAEHRRAPRVCLRHRERRRFRPLPPMHRSKTRRSLFSSSFFFFLYHDFSIRLGRFQKLSSYFNGNLAEKCTIDELNVKSGWIRRGRVNARYHASLGQLYAKA